MVVNLKIDLTKLSHPQILCLVEIRRKFYARMALCVMEYYKSTESGSIYSILKLKHLHFQLVKYYICIRRSIQFTRLSHAFCSTCLKEDEMITAGLLDIVAE